MTHHLVSLKYGNSSISLPLPEDTRSFRFTEPESGTDRAGFVNNLIELIGARPVGDRVSVIVADKTRLCGYPVILPWVAEVLEQKGAGQDRVTFYIAYGTHPRQSDQECVVAYGEVYNSYRFIHHDCNDRDAFIELGRTGRGTPVAIRKSLADSSLILTIGAISHHYFAGYGGGRKLIFPGLARRDAIYANHSLYLDRQKGELAEGCRPGNLARNPLAEDLLEIHRMVPGYLSVHALLNSCGQVASYHFGHSYDDFLEICNKLDLCYKVETDRTFDLVLASTGGYPKDINFIQAHKSIHNVAPLVRDGGTLIMLAQCIDGTGSTNFLPYFTMGGPKETFSHLAKNYAGNGGTALAMMAKTERINILLVTELDEAVCKTIGVKKISASTAEEIIFDHSGSTALAANSSMLVVGKKAQPPAPRK
ncbi:lactate racemase domain-containing protein [Desulforhopalus singaporensis]|uniref:Nickel-dependent lactate racemase n=1 Tax=Desulforhopalus singaporensis TaxID=91360 RepID=A0A1H0LD88_9BACT|nr:nickel-dependent lactate racemase [Desulforhopalus singaporensis]SDO66209.1 Nickel-dependent lactate racemase [Desulforhopalus singaporensis]